MPISITWGTRVIFVPKSYLTLVQASPTEIYEMDLNVFRLDLKDLEDDEEGIPFPNTHSHNTEVSLGGITFARVIEIINGYTVTFEDGQYAVNLTGANSNVGDVVNVNQVSVRSNNSAGLISTPDIQQVSFNNGVTIDVNATTIGTVYPAGTPRAPVNNVDDAKIIAEARGLSILYIIGDFTFTATDNIDSYIVIGQNDVKSRITLDAGLSTEGCEFKEATVDGTLDGNTFVRNCTVEDLTYVEGKIIDCVLKGTITLAGNSTTNIINCSDGIAGDGRPTIDMGGSGQPLTVSGYEGEIELINKSGTDKVSIDCVGAVDLDSTVTNGEIFIRGVGTLVDNSGPNASVDWSAFISRENYTDKIYIDTSSGTADTRYPYGTLRYPINNMDDAKTVADALGIKTFSVDGTVSLNQSFDGYRFTAPHLYSANINMNSQSVTGSVFDEIVITGNGTGAFLARGSQISSGMSNVNAILENCILSGTFTVATGGSIQTDGCTVQGTNTVFDANGNGQVSCASIVGVFSLANMTDPSSMAAITGDLVCTALPSCTNGAILIAGNGSFNNLSTVPSVIDKVVPGAVWDETGTGGTFGEMMQTIQRLTGNRVTRSGDIITIYEEDGVTTWRQYDLSSGGRVVV